MTLTERLRERISRAFYSHGLLCASYPIPIILFTALCILACWLQKSVQDAIRHGESVFFNEFQKLISIILALVGETGGKSVVTPGQQENLGKKLGYPLLKLPLPGTGPVEFSTPVKDYAPPGAGPQHGDPAERPDWYVGAPVAYIQQIFVKATVSPWQKNFLAVDVFRSPLSRVFQLVEEIRNHALRDSSGVRSLEEVCLQVTDLLPGLRKLRNLLPEHGCLLLSPGNFWQNDRERFNADPDIIKTIHQHEPKTLQTSATLKDLLFGLPGRYSGVSLYNRRRVVSYTVTLGLQRYDSRFLSSLRSRLKLLHPSPNCSLREEHVVHVHFKEEIGIAELIPLVTTYIILFAYIYFSTRKIDMVKSKWGLALAAVVTVLSSLLMSVGLCTLFGLTPTLNGGEIFPYLVVVIGLENVLVLTKSVVSTPVDLEVKLRIAQGLSNESWSIMKNMATELGIILIGYFTLEFCLFAVVGLVSDFFLQMFFFTTVLSIDIRRMELADLNKRLPPESCLAAAKAPCRARAPALRAHSLSLQPHTITLQPSSLRNLRLPKRLRVIYFFARTRLAQRLIMAPTPVRLATCWAPTPTRPDTPPCPGSRMAAAATALVVLLVPSVSVLDVSNGITGISVFPAQSANTGRPSSIPTWSHSSGSCTSVDPKTQIEPFQPCLEMPDMLVPAASTESPSCCAFGERKKWCPGSVCAGQCSKPSPGSRAGSEAAGNVGYLCLECGGSAQAGDRVVALKGAAGTVIWIGILVYTDPAGLRTYLTSQVTEQSPLGDAGLPPMPVPGGVLPAGDPKMDLSVFPSEPLQLSENQTQQREQKPGLEPNEHTWAQGAEGRGNGQLELGTEAEVTWGAEDEEIWRKLSFRHWPALFSYYNITLAKRQVGWHGVPQALGYISILPAIPVTLYLNPQEALEVRHPQEASRYQPFLAGRRDSGPQPEHSAQPRGHQDVTLYKVAALGLASGMLLVLLLFCLYRVLCPKNYGQNGPGRRRRGDLPCDDYGYSPPETEIVPLVLRGHLMDIECLASDGMLLVSCCLVGQIRVWDAQTGDCLTVIPKPRLRRDSSGIFDYQEGWDASPDGKNGLEDSFESSHQLKRLLGPPQPPLFCDQPDLTSLIDTNFSEHAKAAESEPRLRAVGARHKDSGYDFSSLVGKVYEEHGSSSCRNMNFPGLSAPHGPAGFSPACGSDEGGCGRRRSLGDRGLGDEACAGCDKSSPLPSWGGDLESSIWSLELQGNLIVAGRSNGKLEVWDAIEGTLRSSNDEGQSGITALVFLNNRIVAARLNGSLDFFSLDTHQSLNHLQFRGEHVLECQCPALGSLLPLLPLPPCGPGRSSLPPSPELCRGAAVRCQLTHSVACAHHKPITALKAAAGRLVTGSQDHTLRVFRLEDSCCLFTLQGHSGAITAVYIDQTMVLASGGQDGAICLWDVLTGSRVSHMFAHRGDVTSLTCTTSCELGCGASLGVISDNLLVTGGQGCVSFWDIGYGDLLQTVYLGKSNESQPARQILVLENAAIVCNFGSELSLVYVPSVLEKLD
ncbi:hypothetical protein IHE44_0000021 [Lamprotornis superbus]|uniref:Sterol regulatory element-binding protein cleavage-activating protein n=1 Tax=Lamprotornis superbus TaxID=245042 RepID=A0A835TXF8_9PASS|nr:hypothetical protein IHE44_0000021 [Lamprotornis superbus]